MRTLHFNINESIFSEGCDNDCDNHGNCVLVNNMYSCVCNDGWEGESCSVRLEMECNDEIDNDKGLPNYHTYNISDE